LGVVSNVANVGSHIVGGAVGQGLSTVHDGIDSYEAFKHHQIATGIVDGVEAGVHLGLGIVEGIAGDWL